MKYYQEITLLPDTEITLGFLWQKLFQQVHIALAENKISDTRSAIGLSFPEYGQRGFPLGSKLRVFANEESELIQLNLKEWLLSLSDYTHVKSVQSVPDSVSYVSFVRIQKKSEIRIEKDKQSKALLWSKKSGKPIEECLSELEKSQPIASLDLPFIWTESQTAKRNGLMTKFPLSIKRVNALAPKSGLFTCYGLSSAIDLVTVPDF